VGTKMYFVAVVWVSGVFDALRARGEREENDRGDVPGWVMITLMSALLVAVLAGVFRAKLGDAFQWAIEKVEGTDPSKS
jgi:heme A synthase